jgi:hypothetical protein
MSAEQSARDHFVPEKNISQAVLQANLAAYFGPGAIIKGKVRLGNGDVGWLIDGGRVTPAIIDTLRKETQKAARPQQTLVPTTPSSRHVSTTTAGQGKTPSNAGRAISSSTNRPTLEQIPSRTPVNLDQLPPSRDRHTMRTDSPSRPHLPQRSSSYFAPDEAESLSPGSQDRYRPTDAMDITPHEIRHPQAATSISRHEQGRLESRHGKSATFNTDPAYAASHPERKFTEQDFDDYKEFKRYLLLKQTREQQPLLPSTSDNRERSRRHQNDGSFIGDPLPANQPEDAAIRPRRHDSLRAGYGRDDDDEDPDYGGQRIPQSNRHVPERGPDVRTITRKFGRDEDDDDPDGTPDYALSMAIANPQKAKQDRDGSTNSRDNLDAARKSGAKGKDKARGFRR